MGASMKLFHFLKDLAFGKVTENYTQDEIDDIAESIGQGYAEYLDRPDWYKDMVIKRMYKNTIYANKEPEELRDIFYKQATGKERPEILKRKRRH